jgi:integrase
MCSVNFHLDQRGKGDLKPIVMQINSGNSQAKRSTGIKIRTSDWNHKDGCPNNVYSEAYRDLTEIRKLILGVVVPELKEKHGKKPHVKVIAEGYTNRVTKIGGETKMPTTVTGIIEKLISERSQILSKSRSGQYSRASALISKSGVNDSVDSVGKTWIIRFVDYMIGEGFRNTTIMQYVKIIRACFEYFDLDPKFKLKDLKTLRTGGSTHSKKSFLTLQQVANMLHYDSKTEDQNQVIRMFVFASLTGLRHNELIRLKTTNVSAKEGVFYLTYTTSKNGGKTITVPLSKMASYLIDLEAVNTGYEKLLFPNISTSKCNRLIRVVFVEMGFTDVQKDVSYSGNNRVEELVPMYDRLTFHSSRASYISNLLNEGMSVKDVSELVGISPTTLLKHYALSEDQSRNDRALGILNKVDYYG